MKKLILIVIFSITISTYLSSQNAFPTSNAIWNYKVQAEDWFSSMRGEKNIYYNICGDTIVDDIICYKLYTSYDTIICSENLAKFLGYIRQDEQKVFFTPYDEGNYFIRPNFGGEYLIYDFGLSVGDTIYLDYGFYYRFWQRRNDGHEFIDQYRRLIVDQIITIGTGQKKIIFDKDVWYEGMGSINGLFYNGERTLDGYSFSIYLNCFKHNDTIKYISNTECNKCFCRNYINIKEGILDINNINIYPNPATDILNIETPENIKLKSIEIYSIGGKLIEKNRYSYDSGKLNISNLKKGSYILKLEADNIEYKKLIIKE